jgi:GntR family transcriptional regulator, arabinose operon transcriptional repressor
MDLLRERIDRGELKPGTAMPSESALIAEFQISSTTARRCLNELAQQGLVNRVQGKGTFVASQAAFTAVRCAGILYHELVHLADTFSGKLLHGINQAMSPTRFEPLLLDLGMIRRQENPGAALAELAKRWQLEALLIVSPSPLGWYQRVLDQGLPVASVNFAYEDPRIFSVVCDVEPASKRIADELVQHGHRRVVAIRKMFRGSLEGVALTTVRPPADSPLEWICETYHYFEPDESQEIVLRHLRSPNPPTAFVAMCYESALLIRHAVRNAGLSIPQDVSLLYWGVPPGPSDLDGETVPIERMSGTAIRMLLDRVEFGATHRDNIIRFLSEAYRGSTLGPAPKQRQ